jgi:hypothetical protein
LDSPKSIINLMMMLFNKSQMAACKAAIEGRTLINVGLKGGGRPSLDPTGRGVG